MAFKDYHQVDPAYLHQLFRYDADSGKVFWKHRPQDHFESDKTWKWWNARFAGKEAGTPMVTKRAKGIRYRIVGFDGCRVVLHKIVWALHHGVWPKLSLDHDDLDGYNNRIGNLKEATQADQMRNQPLRSDSSSGVTGVNWHKRQGKWQVRINGDDGKTICLGMYSDFDEAVQARLAAARALGYSTGLKGER